MPTPQRIPDSGLSLYVAISKYQKDVTELLSGLTDEISGILGRQARADGAISTYNEKKVIDQVNNAVDKIFVGPDGQNAYQPNSTVPLAPYPSIINSWLTWSTAKVIEEHADFIRDKVPNEVYKWLQTRQLRPISFKANYSPPHFWVDPRGYRLSDRIWHTSLRTRAKIDRVVSDGIRTGRGARAMSKDLEAMLKASRRDVRTSKPYRQDASFDAMRLGRSEITRAHVTAQQIAGVYNPFVDGGDWALSARHPDYDICDQLATIGTSGERIKDPYPIASAPIPVVNSHPQCICTFRVSPTKDIGAVRDRLESQFAGGLEAPETPADEIPFAIALIGEFLVDQILDSLKDAYVSG